MHAPSKAVGKAAFLVLVLTVLSMAPPFARSAAAQCQASCAGLPGIGPVTPAARSYESFINRAYVGAYNRLATCSERQAEWIRLANADANGRLLEEARRFVATLFMTQASYDVQDLITYRQTTAYQAINPQENVDRASIEAFVTDLYQAFLQRTPDSAGLCFWSNNVCAEGRKKGIRAFEASIELEDLVEALFEGPFPCEDPDPDPCFPGRICPQ